MSKYRCPVCGASHKEEPYVCRMCGYRIAENMGSLEIADTGTKPLIRTRSGFGKPMVVALVGVVLLAAAAVGLGFIATEDDATVDQIRQQVPGLQPDTPDGWGAVSSEEASFASEFPEIHEEASRELDSATLVGFESEAGEVALFIGSGDVGASDEDVDDRLQAYAEQLLGVPADKWDADSKTEVLGLRALQVQEEKQLEPGVYRTFNALLVLNGDRLYVIESASKEDPAATTTDPPDEFKRVAGTFQITA